MACAHARGRRWARWLSCFGWVSSSFPNRRPYLYRHAAHVAPQRHVYLAKVAEQSERYKDMVTHVKAVRPVARVLRACTPERLPSPHHGAPHEIAHQTPVPRPYAQSPAWGFTQSHAAHACCLLLHRAASPRWCTPPPLH